MGKILGVSPDGSGLNEMKVDNEGQAQVFAVIEDELEHQSEKNGQSFNWCSGTVNLIAGETILLLKNTSDKQLHVESITVWNGSVASEYTIHLPTTEVTPTGTAVTGTNLNTGSSEVADALAKSDETDNSQGNIVFTPYLAVDSSKTVNTRGLILAKNKSVAIDVVEDTAESSVTIRGFFK